MKVVAALSGGVDSSVAAALLHQAGHQVVGITLKLAPDAPHQNPASRRCCSVDDSMDARSVCTALGIPFYVMDARQRFADQVIAPFVSAYRGGTTPIPCVACNQHLKFGHLLSRAKALESHLATGHYARNVPGPHGPELHRPVDTDRDQTYYLYSMGRDALDILEFPLGSLLKPDVRALADQMGLPVSHKPDSQEICFVPDAGHAAFVEKWDGQGARPGRLVDASGQQVGTHPGVHALTVGQRKGLRVTGKDRLYVLQLDAATGDARVGPEPDLWAAGLVADAANWLVHPNEMASLWNAPVWVQVRAHHSAAQARLEPMAQQPGAFRAVFDQPQRAVAPGQSAVVYRGTRCLGGGIIQTSMPTPRSPQAHPGKDMVEG